MKKILLIIVFFCLLVSAKSQVLIYGIAPSYKNLTINVFKFKNYLNFDTITLKTFKCDSLGKFQFSLNISKPEMILFDLDFYWAFLFVQPNGKYQILLPTHKQKTELDFINPFFEPKKPPILIKKSTDSLHIKILEFDNAYSKTLKKLLTTKNKKIFDSLIKPLELIDYKNAFFQTYKKYKIQSLKFYCCPQTKQKIVSQFVQDSVYLRNPSYMSLFRDIFNNFFDPTNEQININCIYRSLKQQSYEGLKICFSENQINQNSKLEDLVIIFGLYQMFYDVKPAQKDILITLEHIANKSQYSQIRKIAYDIYSKFKQLMEDYPAPNFSLPNKKGKYISLTKYTGKFVYLQFCHPKSYSCLKQLPVLERFWQTRPKNFEIITIFVSQTPEQMKEFLKKYKYKWTFLYWNNDLNLLKKYQVKSFPTYFLIYPDGTLAVKEAQAPTENFETQFKAYQKKWYLKQKEKQKIQQ